MKTLLSILLIAALASCKKNDCKNCRLINITIYNTTNTADTTFTELCGKSDAEVRQYEQTNTFSDTASTPPLQVIARQTSCN